MMQRCAVGWLHTAMRRGLVPSSQSKVHFFLYRESELDFIAFRNTTQDAGDAEELQESAEAALAATSQGI